MTATKISENIHYPVHVPRVQFMMWHGDSSIRSSRNLMTTGSRGLRCLYRKHCSSIKTTMLITAVMDVFMHMYWLLQTTAFAEDNYYVDSFFTQLSHFLADKKLILFSDQSVSRNLRHSVKILHFYSNQPLFNCVVFISKLLSFKISHM